MSVVENPGTRGFLNTENKTTGTPNPQKEFGDTVPLHLDADTNKAIREMRHNKENPWLIIKSFGADLANAIIRGGRSHELPSPSSQTLPFREGFLSAAALLANRINIGSESFRRGIQQELHGLPAHNESNQAGPTLPTFEDAGRRIGRKVMDINHLGRGFVTGLRTQSSPEAYVSSPNRLERRGYIAGELTGGILRRLKDRRIWGRRVARLGDFISAAGQKLEGKGMKKEVLSGEADSSDQSGFKETSTQAA